MPLFGSNFICRLILRLWQNGPALQTFERGFAKKWRLYFRRPRVSKTSNRGRKARSRIPVDSQVAWTILEQLSNIGKNNKSHQGSRFFHFITVITLEVGGQFGYVRRSMGSNLSLPNSTSKPKLLAPLAAFVLSLLNCLFLCPKTTKQLIKSALTHNNNNNEFLRWCTTVLIDYTTAQTSNFFENRVPRCFSSLYLLFT